MILFIIMFYFKTIEREDPNATHLNGFVKGLTKRQSSIDSSISVDNGSNSPTVTQALYSTGFIYKNHNSPRCANHPISPQMQRTIYSPKESSIPIDTLFGFGNDNSELRTKSCLAPKKALGSIGWGVGNPRLNIRNERRVMLEQPHKQAYNHGMLKNNLHMETSGFFSEKVDSWLGIPYHMLD